MQLHIPGCRPESRDEISSKKIHLTYAALIQGELTHESLLASARRWAQDRGGLLEYTSGHELHTQDHCSHCSVRQMYWRRSSDAAAKQLRMLSLTSIFAAATTASLSLAGQEMAPWQR